MPSNAESLYPDCPTVIRTVEVGGLTQSEMLQEYRNHAISMNAQGERLFVHIPFTQSGSAYILETVQLTVRSLGFPEGATSDRLFHRARKVGLDLCPLEVGPYLRLQYLEQPPGPWIVIASHKPPAEPDGPNGFYLRRLVDGLWLRGYTASPEHVWDADEQFIFCQRRQ